MWRVPCLIGKKKKLKKKENEKKNKRIQKPQREKKKQDAVSGTGEWMDRCFGRGSIRIKASRFTIALFSAGAENFASIVAAREGRRESTVTMETSIPLTHTTNPLGTH